MSCVDAEASAAALAAALATPRRVKGDAGEVEAHSLADRIALDRYLAAKCAGQSGHPGFGIRLSQVKPPGAV